MKSLSCVVIVAALGCVGCESKSVTKPAPPPQPPVLTPESSQLPSESTRLPPNTETVTITTPAEPESAPTAANDPKWISLFDGQSLKGWKSTEFGGEGEVKVEEGAIVLAMGQEMTGITWDRKEPPPKNNYEIRLEARRVDGIDFFCALTFPVEDANPSLVVGGWSGSVVGISTIDDLYANENATTKYMEFKTGQWYKIRLKVTKDRLQAWIDDEEVIDYDIEGRKVGNHPSVELSKPLGIATYLTVGAIRKIELRKLD